MDDVCIKWPVLSSGTCCWFGLEILLECSHLLLQFCNFDLGRVIVFLDSSASNFGFGQVINDLLLHGLNWGNGSVDNKRLKVLKKS